ncbi:MAG: hypothetical protein IJR13_03300 [Bacteroidales bacterium]|nr:hypothetical protein [Bacteroidales bacterium]
MPTIEATIANIESKVRRLVDERDLLSKKVEEQAATIVELQKTITQNNIIITNLKEETNKSISTRNTSTERSIPADIEPRITQLIETIDESLSLLGYKQ